MCARNVTTVEVIMIINVELDYVFRVFVGPMIGGGTTGTVAQGPGARPSSLRVGHGVELFMDHQHESCKDPTQIIIAYAV
jgi:hypothetical protein